MTVTPLITGIAEKSTPNQSDPFVTVQTDSNVDTGSFIFQIAALIIVESCTFPSKSVSYLFVGMLNRRFIGFLLF